MGRARSSVSFGGFNNGQRRRRLGGPRESRGSRAGRYVGALIAVIYPRFFCRSNKTSPRVDSGNPPPCCCCCASRPQFRRNALTINNVIPGKWSASSAARDTCTVATIHCPSCKAFEAFETFKMRSLASPMAVKSSAAGCADARMLIALTLSSTVTR